MPYIICNADSYLKQTKQGYSVVDTINKATKWSRNESAEHVCQCMKRSDKYKDYMFEVKFVSSNNEIISCADDVIELHFNILDKIKDISEFAQQLEKRKSCLNSMLSKIDLEIVDIEHAAEFYELNAAQGYKIYKLLHDARIKRRAIKNELEEINLCLGTNIQSINLTNIEKSIIGLSNRKYTPRINKELFGV